ncbi:proline iminopeptidase [Acephala macrosclerotiorum]|nr:proline iminopeptidase [Acephala macrosclerotiorum]
MALQKISLMEGEADFHIEGVGKPYKTHYKIFGTFPSPNGLRPLIVLHGGPGVPHNYMLPIKNLALHGIPVIFYDQLGCGLSTRLPHLSGAAGEKFWTVDLFKSELLNLVEHLKLESYDVLGNSWGGMLGAMHAITQPKGLNKLVLADSPASMELWLEAANKLRSQLPKDVEETLKKHEKDGTTDTPEYEAAVQVFYERHLCRVVPFPKDVTDSFAALAEDNTVYLSMNGPSEFFVVGTLKTWNIIDQIHKIKVPTLLLNGKYDEAQDEVMEPFFKNIEKVKWFRFAESSHMPHVEQEEEYNAVVRNFLTD